MRKTNALALVLMLTAGVVGLALVGGCSESKARRAGRRLLKEVEQAEGLYYRALDYLVSPTHHVRQDRLPPGQELHPDVLLTLKKAEEGLSKVLRDNRDAEAPDKAIAQVMLARILSLRGYCRTTQAYSAIRRVNTTRPRVEAILTSVRLQINLLGYYDELASAGDENIRGLRNQAAAVRSRKSADLAEVDERVATLRKQQAIESEEYANRNAEALVLSIEGRATPGQEGLKKLEEALGIQAKANAAEAKLAEIEREVDTLGARRKALEVDLADAEARIATVDDILGERKTQGAKNVVSLRGVRSRLKGSQAVLKRLLAAMEESCKEIESAQRQAINAYDLSLGKLSSASSAQPEDRLGTAASRADVLMATADLQARCVAVVEGNSRLAGVFGRVWREMGAAQLPLELAKIQSFLGDPLALRDQAEKRYSQAVKLYGRALRDVDDRRLRWSYQGQLAAAYMRLHAFSRKDDLRAEAFGEATKALDEATENKRFSPHLSSVVALRKILKSRRK